MNRAQIEALEILERIHKDMSEFLAISKKRFEEADAKDRVNSRFKNRGYSNRLAEIPQTNDSGY